jgi:hypothetical protein
MGQFFQVNGDYNIKTKGGGTITFDTGIDPITNDPGNVNIVGNLLVTGDLTSVSSSNLEIVDRILVLNKGEDTGNAGVSLIYSGIEINRAASDSAAFVWDENSDSWIIATGSNDDDLTVNTNNYSFNNSNLKLRRILTDASTDSGDLTLIGTGTGVVKVAGTTNYRLQVTDNDDIPNKDYVDFSILNNPTFQIRAPSQDTRVIIADKDVLPNIASTGGSLAFYQNATGRPISSDGASESGIGFLVDNALTATFYSNRVVLQSLEIVDSEIRHDSSNENIFINTNGTGKLQTNYAIQLDNNAVSPAIVSGSHVIYSRSQSAGKSGIYFVNTENTRDELVSKNRALLFSMLF